MKFLIYNHDYGDEFDVSAVSVMTEEEYAEWLEQPTGEFNEDYEEQFKIHKAAIDAYEKFIEGMKERNIYTKPQKDFTKEELEWYKANEQDYVYYRDAPRKIENSYIRGWLGNYGDYFDEPFLDYKYNKELVSDNIVEVYDVSDNFAKTFDEIGLSRINLTNIVDFDKDW